MKKKLKKEEKHEAELKLEPGTEVEVVNGKVFIRTYIPEKSIYVSTVRDTHFIGFDYIAETAVFKLSGNKIDKLIREIPHYRTDLEYLKKKHREIVEKIKRGESLEEVET